MAVRLGVPGARSCYEYIHGELRSTTMPHYRRAGQARFSIDPDTDYAGMWWNAPAGSEAGWGISIAQQGDVIFAAWYTYDAANAPWWLSMVAERTGPATYAGTIYQTNGPSFSAAMFDPAAVSRSAIGTASLVFADSANAEFQYTINGATAAKSLTRFHFANPVPVCTFGLLPDPASATNYQDVWWNSPPGSEAGWGLSIDQQGDTIFAVWFTYAENRAPLWLACIARETGAGSFTGPLYRCTGPAFDATPFNPSAVATTTVGSASFTFQDGNRGTFAYTLGAVSAQKAITREIFRAPGTVCA
jgi:hypothetical protein